MRRVRLRLAAAALTLLLTAACTPAQPPPQTPASAWTWNDCEEALTECRTVQVEATMRLAAEISGERPAAFDSDLVTITALDVGQGDAVLVDFGFGRMGCGTEWLIDGGPSAARLRERINIQLQWTCDLDALVLTHPHTDHYQGLRLLLQRAAAAADDADDDFAVSGLFTNGEDAEGPRWAEFRSEAAAAHVALIPMVAGAVYAPAPGRRSRLGLASCAPPRSDSSAEEGRGCGCR